MELNALLLINQWHVALDAVVGRGDGTDDVCVDRLVVTLNAVLDVFLRTRPVIGRMGIVTGCASQAFRRFEAAFAAEHTDGLKANQVRRVVTEFLLGHAAGQTMAIPTQLDFRLSVPCIEANGVGRRVGISA